MIDKTKYNLKALVIFILIIEVLFWPVFFSQKYYLEENDPKFQFENPDMLWFLFIIPAFLLFVLWNLQNKNKRLQKFADASLIQKLSQEKSTFITALSMLFIRMSIFCFVLALANPQFGKGERIHKSEGVDIIIALDISNSMLASDKAGQINRLKKSKLDIERLIGKLGGDRLGLIVFAGAPVVQLPVTEDLAASKFFLSGINTNMISLQGTDIGSAISLALVSFPKEDKRQKVLIIITDGEDHEPDAVLSALEAQRNKITVHTIGYGSEKGAPIPVYENEKYKGLKRDQEGNTIITRLNSKLLKEIAQAGGGIYVAANETASPLEIIRKEIRKMQQTEIATAKFPEYEDRFQIFVGMAILFLILEMLLPNKSFDLFTKIIQNAG